MASLQKEESAATIPPPRHHCQEAFLHPLQVFDPMYTRLLGPLLIGRQSICMPLRHVFSP